jgi:hypothetical protein
MYNISVTRRGRPVPESDEYRELKEYRKDGLCASEWELREIKPGESLEYDMEVHYFAEVHDPGTYQVTVSRKTFPWNPEKSVTVFSNTLTINVPASDDQSPSGDSKAGFKLNLSAHYDHSTFVKNIIGLTVTMTNTSKQTIRFSPCAAFGGLYKVLVVYNGVPIDEPEWARKHREAMEKGEANGGFCEGSDPGQKIEPGESAEDTLRWKAEKEGTYQFTVEQKTFPKDPNKSVTVKSNTVTITMPEPAAGKKANDSDVIPE